MTNALDRQDSANGDEALAHDLANFADSDATEPKPENLREGWETETRLNKVGKQLGYDEKEWSRYARICERAAHRTQLPEAAALFQIGQLNGARRIPQPDWNLVAQFLRDTGSRIAGLGEGTRKQRVQELHAYHHGITARYTGDYKAAAEFHRKIAENNEARNDPVGTAISRLSEQVDRFSQALLEGSETEQLLAPLEEAAQRVVASCTDDQDSTQTQWHYFSAPAHVLEAHIWSKRPITPESEARWLAILTEEFAVKDPKQFENLQPTIIGIKAGLAMLKNDRNEALRLAQEVETVHIERAMPNARATAVFVLNALGEDQAYTGPGALESACGYMHQVIALIRRNREQYINQPRQN